MKTINKFCMLAYMLLCVSGCVNISEHIYNPTSYKPYEGTCVMHDAMTEVFMIRPELHRGNGGEATIAHAYAICWSPCIFVDLPGEFVFDTITFLYDVIPSMP